VWRRRLGGESAGEVAGATHARDDDDDRDRGRGVRYESRTYRRAGRA